MKPSDLKAAVLSLLFPRICPLCGERAEEDGLCSACRRQYAAETFTHCPRCGKTAGKCACGREVWGGMPPPLVLTFYIPPGRQREDDGERVTERMLFLLKERGELAGFFARECARAVRSVLSARGEDPARWTVTFAPRSAEKFLRYGFDQGDEAARRIAGLLGASFVPTLARVRTSSEQKTLGREARTANAEEGLLVKSRAVKPGMRILLFDDIITTGATVRTCARLLTEAGAEEVLPFAAARTVPKGK